MFKRFWINIKRTLSMARKEFVHIFMDPGALFLTVFAPGIVLIMLAYVFGADSGTTLITLIDQDQSSLSNAYQRHLTADGNLEIVAYPADTEEAEKYLQSGQAEAFILIPPGFGETLSGGGYAPLQIVIDGVSNSPASTINAIEERTRGFTEDLSGETPLPIEIRTRVWYNENMTAQYSMIPGLMAIVLILPAMSVALGMTREKELGTMETLVTTPVKGENVVVGKLIVYLFLGVVSALLALLASRMIFGLPFRGNLGLWILATACYLLALMGICLLIAHFTKSQQTAMIVILISTFIPGFEMSGLTSPVDKGWGPAAIFSKLLPMTHYIEVSRALALKDLPFSMIWIQTGALFLMGVGGVALAVRLFRKKIA